MDISCGTDIIETKRIKDAVARWKQAFLKKIFTKRELDYSMSKKFYFEHLAARFAAKEAVLKGFGSGFTISDLKDVEILNDENGKPCVFLKDKIENLAKQKNIKKITISMSHTRNYAQAVAILLGSE